MVGVAGELPASEIKAVGRQTTGCALTDFPGVFSPLSNRKGPPQKQTAAQGVGSQRGGKTEVKASENLQVERYSARRFNAIAKLPSKATLAKKWPALKINRYTGRWRDGASAAYGADVASLLAFLDGKGAL